MAELIAYHVEGPQGMTFGIHGFGDNIILSLPLPRGKYVVHARIGVGNQDGNEQQMSCAVKVRGTLQYVDRLDVRLILGSHAMWFALQGVVDLPEGDTLDLTAGSYDAYAAAPRLLAFNVEDIVPPV